MGTARGPFYCLPLNLPFRIVHALAPTGASLAETVLEAVAKPVPEISGQSFDA